jgi:5'-3' exonuclease
MAKILLAVDLSYQTYRAAAAHPMLTCGDVFTGGLYGFFQTLGKMVRETEATHLVFCQDRKPYLRSLTYPEYKQLRKKAADDEMLRRYTQSMKLVLEVLTKLRAPIWGLDGFESDDMIAHSVSKYWTRFDRIYAGSNDSDLFQWLNVPNFYIYTKDIASCWTRARLWKEHGITPEQYMIATALTGTHNDIAGIAGVGPVTAIKAVRDPGLMRSMRDKHAALIDRNLALIKLPHPQFPAEERLPSFPEGFNARDLYKLLGRYDIDVTAAMVNAFEQVQPKRVRHAH